MTATESVDLDALQQAATKACGLLKTLSNRDRLLLMCQLAEGEYCVSELEEATDIRQPTLSQQLTVLREEQLVHTRREGKQIYYSMASKEAMAIIEVLYQQYCAPAKRKKS